MFVPVSVGQPTATSRVSVASDTSRYFDPTETIGTTQNTALLAYKFIPKSAGELKISVDIATVNGIGTPTFGLTFLNAITANPAINYQTPIGTTVGTATFPTTVLFTATSSTTYATYTGVLVIPSIMPVYFVITIPNVASGSSKVKNLNISYDFG